MPSYDRVRSPYTYSPRRRRAGQDPSKVPVRYIETSRFAEAQYVVTRKDNEFCLRVFSEFIWDYDDECRAAFRHGETTFTIQRIRK